MFSSKISETAKQVGAQIVFCRSAEGVPSDATRICVDLNATTFDALAEIRKLKSKRGAPIFAYLSHVQVDLKKQAEEAGSDGGDAAIRLCSAARGNSFGLS